MKIVHSISSFAAEKPTVVTIGTFDGVHLGHRKILEQLIHSAKTSDSESLVLTFFPHPRMVLQQGTEMKQLNTMAEKTALLESLGIDHLVIHPFDKEFSRLTAEEFVHDVLVNTFKIQKIIIGHDHRFGRNRTADINDLVAFGAEFGFEVAQISAQQINEVSVSSTKIRTALEEGHVTLANQYLGYPYSLTGTVTQGKQLGRTIGYPTANIAIAEEYKLIPQNGVYIVQSTINGTTVNGMMNIGTRPTVDGTTQTIEVHFFDFNENLYRQNLTVSILERMRAEQKFESLDALKSQLAEDQRQAKAYFEAL
ncbi:bifunctional riboflavin kinase/FAD synthetase [Flavobacterium sedimenticola]|uniref:Riboflavin biosynthesis protein n=1 Tax=Flavobacterium sedimenticola TaxID=3043286 RepID=A0ABT6XMJ8_9FLAO|nr:bifunctional riboflavin kinase/FAD synthetase [Flavobacterium sedimenticola]MDI9256296.1 bifunctional riboflavin kinase/FAD synthetase [Flavobacterium sedimenticola]